MALVYKDRVKETSTTTGTGAYTLAGAVSGFQSFSEVGNGNTCYYTAEAGASWEVGLGTWSTGGTLARTSVLASSNSNNAVSWSAGSKTVFLTAPATVFAALYANPITTRGDIVTGGVAGAVQRLALGAAGAVATSDGTDVGWAVPTLGAASSYRLTLSDTLSLADVASSASVYCLHHRGKQGMLIWTGAAWTIWTGTVTALDVSGLSDGAYDFVVEWNAGAPRLASVAWSNVTTPPAARTTRNGVAVVTVSTVDYVLLGSARVASGVVVDDAASRKRHLSNLYNRERRDVYARDATDAWTQDVDDTWRQARSTSTNAVEVFDCVAGSIIRANVYGSCLQASGRRASVGVGIDSTTVDSAQQHNGVADDASNYYPVNCEYTGAPGVGLRVLNWLEAIDTTGGTTTTWAGDGGAGGLASQVMSGIRAEIQG